LNERYANEYRTPLQKGALAEPPVKMRSLVRLTFGANGKVAQSCRNQADAVLLLAKPPGQHDDDCSDQKQEGPGLKIEYAFPCSLQFLIV